MSKKTLSVAKKKTGVRPATTTTRPKAGTKDPFLNETARIAEINANSPRGRQRWIPKRPGFLKKS